MSKFEIYVMLKLCLQILHCMGPKKTGFPTLAELRHWGITTGNVHDFISFRYAFFCLSSTRFLKINNRLRNTDRKKVSKLSSFLAHTAFVGFSGRWKIGTGQNKNLEIEDLYFTRIPTEEIVWALTKSIQISCQTGWIRSRIRIRPGQIVPDPTGSGPKTLV
jgi:hypothetical protein